MKKLSDYIIEYPNVLSDEFCDQVITKFEADERSYLGTTIGKDDKWKDWKKSTDLNISNFDDWKEEDDIFYKALNENLVEYKDKFGVGEYSHSPRLLDSGYQIQRTTTNQYYKWHHDCTCKYDDHADNFWMRLYTYIFYLTDDFEGGRTQFFPNFKKIHNVNPKKGKLILFPANPLWVHQGEPVTAGTKYIVTGWIYSNLMRENQ